MFSLELSWLDWSRALTTSRLVANRANHPDVPLELSSTTPVRWRDLYVAAFGLASSLDGESIFPAGVNAYTDPVRTETENPTFNVRQHSGITVGYGDTLVDGWRYDLMFEHQMGTTQRYRNPDLPLGEFAKSSYEACLAIFLLSRRW